MLRLRRIRQERGISIVGLTQLTGIAPSSISEIECEVRPPWPGWKARISEALGIPADELFQPEAEDDRG